MELSCPMSVDIKISTGWINGGCVKKIKWQGPWVIRMNNERKNKYGAEYRETHNRNNKLLGTFLHIPNIRKSKGRLFLWTRTGKSVRSSFKLKITIFTISTLNVKVHWIQQNKTREGRRKRRKIRQNGATRNNHYMQTRKKQV